MWLGTSDMRQVMFTPSNESYSSILVPLMFENQSINHVLISYDDSLQLSVMKVGMICLNHLAGLLCVNTVVNVIRYNSTRFKCLVCLHNCISKGCDVCTYLSSFYLSTL